MNSLDTLDGLSSAQLRELVAHLFAKLAELERTNAELREEIARLKGLNLNPAVDCFSTLHGTTLYNRR